MRRSISAFLLPALALWIASIPAWAQETVEQWGIFELTLKGPTNGNPFVDTHFSARFAWDLGDSAATEVSGRTTAATATAAASATTQYLRIKLG